MNEDMNNKTQDFSGKTEEAGRKRAGKMTQDRIKPRIRTIRKRWILRQSRISFSY